VTDSSVNDRVKRVRGHIDQLYSTGKALGDDGQLYSFLPASVTPGRARFMGKICAAEGALTSVETGMAWGLSTLTILEALIQNGAGQRAHVVMDPAQSSKYHKAAVRAVRDVGAAEMLEFYEEPSELALPRLLAQGRRFDFAYIDGNHTFEGAFIDFFYIDRMLKPGGVLVIDDYNLHAVRLTCDFAISNQGYTLIDEDFDGVKPHKERRWFGLGSPVPSLPWIRAYRKPMEQPDRKSFRLLPMYMGFSQYHRYAGNQLRQQGLAALAYGDAAAARRALIQAIKAEPDHFKPYLALARTFLPRKVAKALSGGGRDKFTA
jgi:hypothetical protein